MGSPTSSTTTSTSTTTVTMPALLEAFGTAHIEVAGQEWLVAVADSPAERAQGLMGVTDLGPLEGMLFVMDGERRAAFWMKDTLIPLDIAFFDTDGRLVEVLTMVPCEQDPCPTYQPDDPYLWALETPAGRLSDLPEDALLAFPGG